MNNTMQPSDRLKRSLVEWHEFAIPDLFPRGYNRTGGPCDLKQVKKVCATDAPSVL